ncbi:MAG: glycosyl hydrolase [Edaphobacter sp.]|uniref:glycosyl hydrolase n=1 Tax=Edaphobacter sp. TaxID=1934404 RepID=UPI0023A6B700|nr:glycosyl hydrolase [Edaphobacter sp.]MDE1175202.1 glycosyl hydrolase [Edaphobacter sp.]
MRLSSICSTLFVCGLTGASLAQSKPAIDCNQSSSINRCLLSVMHTPPANARPMVRWWWFGVAADKAEILKELQQMKADDIGGVELAFVYPQIVNDPSKGIHNDPFLSPEMLENVRYAQEQARLLGIRVDVTLGSGWPYGGPATTLDEAAHRLRVMEIPLPKGVAELPKVKLAAGESIVSVSVVNGAPHEWDAASAVLIRPVTAPLPASGKDRVALFFIDSHTRQVVKRASVGAEGWVLDPFQRKAVETHLDAVGGPLVRAFGKTPPYAIFSDSLEAYGADWTPNLPQEFMTRRGYDLLPHLPELVAGGTPQADAIRHDWGKTLTELVEQNYLIPINTWAKEHHTQFRSQTYGEPAVTLSSQRLVALAEGEGPYWRQFNTLRWAASGNHLYGQNITSAETFTWLHSPVFRATPLDMKAEADLHFIVGTNQIIGHGWPYSAPQAGEPGWSLYAAAVFNDHNPWHPVMPDVAGYIQRVSALMRMGRPANQVALLLPVDDAWAGFTPGHVSVTATLAKTLSPEVITAILDAGYNFDFIDAEAIQRVGIHYPILVVPATHRMSLATLQSLESYVAKGGKVISVGDEPSLSTDGKALPEITQLSQKLFEVQKQTHVSEASELGDALHHAAAPDLTLSTKQPEIGFIRRHLEKADIYFVANTSNQTVSSEVSFGSKFSHAVVIDPTSNTTAEASKEKFTLKLAPYESRIFILSNDAGIKSPAPLPSVELVDLSHDWKVDFTSLTTSKSMQSLEDWTSSSDTEHYSGEAVYRRTFDLKTKRKKSVYLSIEGGHPVDSYTAKSHPGTQAWYEGPVREAAQVVVNGHLAGALWHPPYQLDISSYLKPGVNQIELHVFNTAINAWSAQPPHDYKPLIKEYGDRFQMQDMDKVRPVSSGILGTIRLVTVP